MELWLRPAAKPNNRLPQIFSLWDGTLPDLFLIGQWKDSLVLRTRSLHSKAARGYRERGSGHTLIKDQKIFLTLTSSPEGTRLYQNGKQVKEFPGYPLLEDVPPGKGAFILGNSSIGKSYWEGRIYGLALYNRVLSNQEVIKIIPVGCRGTYQKLKSTSGLIGLYTFGEGKGERINNLAADLNLAFKTRCLPPPPEGYSGMAEQGLFETFRLLSRYGGECDRVHPPGVFLGPLAGSFYPLFIPRCLCPDIPAGDTDQSGH